MAGIIFILGAQSLLRPHRGHDVPGQRIGVHILQKSKYKWKVSTEDERIGVDNAMPKMLWSRYLIETHGYNIVHKRIMQDNNSSILLKKMANILHFQTEQAYQD